MCTLKSHQPAPHDGAPKPTPPVQHCIQSCDSCSHAEKTNSKTYPVKCGISKPIPMMVHEYCISWMAYTGCASYSSRPAPAAPRIGKMSDAELDEIAKESYRQITGNQPPAPSADAFVLTIPEYKAIREYIDIPTRKSKNKAYLAICDAEHRIRQQHPNGKQDGDRK